MAVRLRPRNAEERLADADFADCVELQPEVLSVLLCFFFFFVVVFQTCRHYLIFGFKFAFAKVVLVIIYDLFG